MSETETEQPSKLYPALALIEKRKDVLSSMIPKTLQAVMGWERIRQNVGIVMAGSPQLQQCKPATILAAVMKAVSLGLDLDPSLGQAFLVPYGTDCSLIVGAQGKIELAYRSGRIEKIVCQAVFSKDDIIFDLANGDVEHKVTKEQLMDRAANGRGDLIAGYARVWIKDSKEPILELMDLPTFKKIRNASKAKNSPAYRDWEDEMLRRSVLNRALKRCPKSPDLMSVLFDDTDIDTDTRTDVTPDLAGALADMPSLPDHGEPQDAAQVEAALQALKDKEKVTARTTKAKKADVIEAEPPPKFEKPDIIVNDDSDDGEMP